MNNVPNQPGAACDATARWRMGKMRRRVWCFCLLLAMAPAPIFGDASDRTLSQFVHTAWTAKDGVPANVVDIAQTTDGFLWLGTQAGLYRFDGVTFELYQPETGPAFLSNRITALMALPNGDLWIGFQDRGAGLLRDGRCTNYPFADGLSPGNILRFVQDHDGTIWAGTDTGVARFVDSQWRRIGDDWGIASGQVYGIYVDHKRTLWVAVGGNIVFLPQGARRFQTTGVKVGQVMQFTESPDGTLWMAEITRSVRPVPLAENTHGLEPEIQVGSRAILFDDDGSLWTTSVGDGLRRVPFPDRLNGQKINEFSPAAESFTEKDGFSSDFSYLILKDREGSIWVVTQAGLDRFRRGALAPLLLPGKFGRKALFPGDEGNIWVSSDGGREGGPEGTREGGSVARTDGHTWQYTDAPAYFAHVVRDSRGVTWLGTFNFNVVDSGRLFRMEQGKLTFVAKMPSKSASDTGQVLAQDGAGTLWLAGAGHQIFFLKNRNWGELETPPDIAGKTALSAFTDERGRIWFGYTNAIMVLDGRNVRTFTGKDGVTTGMITCITELGGHIWIGGPGGLEVLEGDRFRTIASTGGDWLGFISGVEKDSDGNLFVTETRGVAVIPAAEISKVLENPSARVQVQIFDWRDGLGGTTLNRTPYPDSIRGLDGRIWFSTSSGVSWIDPAHIPKNLLPPPVAIRSITADEKRYTLSAGMKLPPLIRLLVIDYTAPSLAIPERVRFRYKLEGYDTDWQDAGTHREATYTNLSPRQYRFRVIACNNDGVWNETGASLDFTILPAWYQTLWFGTVCIAVFVFLLWGLYLFRLRQLKRQYSALVEERVGERTRIARELHDTLLQSFHGLLFRIQAARNMLPGRSEEAMEALDGVITKGEQAITEGRDTIQELRAESVAHHDLEYLMTATCQELASSQGADLDSTEFSVTVEGAGRTLSPVLQDEVYRIAREVLRNAFTHANARHVEVEIRYDDRMFRLRIRDDGKGIDPKVLAQGRRPGHWGLSGVRERARLIGARLAIWSEAAKGTEVELTIPSSIAYGTFEQRRRFGFLRRTRKS